MEYSDLDRYIHDIAADCSIYKYIPLKYIVDMYQRGKLLVKNVQEWEDVYENYFLKQNFLLDGKPVSTKIIKNNYFGMSWTRLAESDAMWRIYSKWSKDLDDVTEIAVRVKTTARKLLETLTEKMYESPAIIYEVRYKEQAIIDDYLQRLSEGRKYVDVDKGIRYGLTVKRDAFKHEHEVRVFIGVDTQTLKEYKKYQEVDFNPDKLFEDFVLDPRVTNEQEKEMRKLLNTCGIDNSRISKSQLYAFIPHTIELNQCQF